MTGASASDSASDALAASHTEHEDHAWDRNIPNHPPRKDSAEYVQSRAELKRLLAQATTVQGFYFA